MTRDEFRLLALAYPEAVEVTADGATLFMVSGRAFARIRPEARWVDVMLSREDAEAAGAGEPELFAPLPGTWLRPGFTQINLQKAGLHTVESALNAAWANVAPRKLAQRHSPRRSAR